MDSSGEKKEFILSLGQLRAAQGEEAVLVSLGLGSCVALCAYDPVSKVGGMAHMVLPERGASSANGASPKFVDCAIPMLFEEMELLGAVRLRLNVKIVGGAQMLQLQDEGGLFNIGSRNVESAKTVLAGLGVPLAAAETGGRKGRTVRLFLDSGKLVASHVGESSFEL